MIKAILNFKLMKKILLAIIIFMSIANTANAMITIPDKYRPDNLPNSLEVGDYGSDTINAYLQFFAGRLIKIAGPLAVMMIVFAGSMMAMSRGEGQLEESKKKILYAILGLGLILISFVMVTTIITIIYEIDG